LPTAQSPTTITLLRITEFILLIWTINIRHN
jgi:hypothetical protein